MIRGQESVHFPLGKRLPRRKLRPKNPEAGLVMAEPGGPAFQLPAGVKVARQCWKLRDPAARASMFKSSTCPGTRPEPASWLCSERAKAEMSLAKKGKTGLVIAYPRECAYPNFGLSVAAGFRLGTG